MEAIYLGPFVELVDIHFPKRKYTGTLQGSYVGQTEHLYYRDVSYARAYIYAFDVNLEPNKPKDITLSVKDFNYERTFRFDGSIGESYVNCLEFVPSTVPNAYYTSVYAQDGIRQRAGDLYRQITMGEYIVHPHPLCKVIDWESLIGKWVAWLWSRGPDPNNPGFCWQ